MKLKAWVKAARLRTLPLSLSGIIGGSFVAFKQGDWNTTIFVLALLTTLFFQIVSNFANDLGDIDKGTDNEERLGPIRGLQAGIISRKEMIIAIIVTSLFSLITAIPLVIIGTRDMHFSILWGYLILALLCIIAAITYTVGKKAYGYHGLGDVMVFLFFGGVSTVGVYGLYNTTFEWSIILPACSIGLLSVAVLNINNMRDHENDKAVNKNTLVVKMGFKNARFYHTFLIIGAFICLSFYFYITSWSWLYFALLPFIVLVKHLIFIWKVKFPQQLDNEMKKVALSTFAIVLLLWGIELIQLVGK